MDSVIQSLQTIGVPDIELILVRFIESVDGLIEQKKSLPILSVGLSQGNAFRGTPLKIGTPNATGQKWVCFMEDKALGNSCLWFALHEIRWLGLDNPGDYLEILSAGKVINLAGKDIPTGLDLRKQMIEISNQAQALYGLSLSFESAMEKKFVENQQLRWNAAGFDRHILSALQLVAIDEMGMTALRAVGKIVIQSGDVEMKVSRLSQGLTVHLPSMAVASITPQKIKDLISRHL
jgi:hypothetical protein